MVLLLPGIAPPAVLVAGAALPSLVIWSSLAVTLIETDLVVVRPLSLVQVREYVPLLARLFMVSSPDVDPARFQSTGPLASHDVAFLEAQANLN